MTSNASSKASSFSAHTVVVTEQVGRGTKAKGVRRAFLVERSTGRILELQTAFLDHEFGLKGLNTQRAVLADLAFFHQWCIRKSTRDPEWVSPQNRAAANELSLNEREIKDLTRWCQHEAHVLIAAAQDARSGVSRLPLGEIVSHSTRNRRLRYISRFLQWLTIQLATDENTPAADTLSPEVRRVKLQRCFHKQMLAEPKTSGIKSLTPTQSDSLKAALLNKDAFPDDAIGTRDRIIFEVLLQGLRAGEGLKIRCNDVYEDYPLDRNRSVAAVAIVRSVNDIDDVRKAEPAVKTLEGLLPIPKRLAKDIVSYVRGPRRAAVDQCQTRDETQYLFVNHHGRHIGQPISQRNFNRIVAKLRGRFDLPDNLHPHALRHTHFTELADDLHKKGRGDSHIKELLIQRGRWVPDSREPARYTERALIGQSAEYVEARDAELNR